MFLWSPSTGARSARRSAGQRDHHRGRGCTRTALESVEHRPAHRSCGSGGTEDAHRSREATGANAASQPSETSSSEVVMLGSAVIGMARLDALTHRPVNIYF